MKTYVLYHGGCYDGFCAAWVAHGILGDTAEYIPVNYGMPMLTRMYSGSKLYILDFSYPREVLLRLECQGLVILDHHKTAEEQLRGLPGAVFDINKSGARLTWEHFHGSAKAPWLVDYTEDRDLWRWKLPHSREINAALRTLGFFVFSVWDELSKKVPESLVAEGSAILLYEKLKVEQHVAHAVEQEIDGHKVLVVNATTLISEIGEQLAKGRPFGATFFERMSDGKRVWSLRSNAQGVDVGSIAKLHGGEGHRNAAGFEE